MLAAGLIVLAPPAEAAITFSVSAPGNDSGETNAASVTFDLSISGPITNLIVTLSNDATYIPNDLPDILSGVFFTIAGNPTLTRLAGNLASGSGVVAAGTNVTIVGTDIGGSWTYKSGLSGAPGGANQGISSAGFGLFGPTDVFPGNPLPGDSVIPDGGAGGLTTVVDGGTSDGLDGRPLIQHAAEFVLGNVPGSFTLDDISNVSFQYGTSLGEQNIVAVPEPSPMALATSAGLLLVWIRLRQRYRWMAHGAITASGIPCRIFLSEGHTVARIPPSFASSPTTK
jgi:hypothetical protein